MESLRQQLATLLDTAQPGDLPELAGLFAERLFRLAAPVAATPQILASADVTDAVLSLQKAAAFMGEPPSTFRRRLEYRKALVSRPTEKRRRYSRAGLERIKQDRLEANGL